MGGTSPSEGDMGDPQAARAHVACRMELIQNIKRGQSRDTSWATQQSVCLSFRLTLLFD